MLGTRPRFRRPTNHGAATRVCIMHDPARGTNCIYATRSSSIATLFRPESRNARNLVSWFSGKLLKIVATRCQILRLKCSKFDFGWGSAPDPAGGAYSAPPDPLAGFKGPTSKGRGRKGEGRGRKGWGKRKGEGGGKGREGKFRG